MTGKGELANEGSRDLTINHIILKEYNYFSYFVLLLILLLLNTLDKICFYHALVPLINLISFIILN